MRTRLMQGIHLPSACRVAADHGNWSMQKLHVGYPRIAVDELPFNPLVGKASVPSHA
jgi:hypothetical protein